MKLALVVPTPEVDVPIPVALFSGSFSQRLQKAAALGYDGVELMPARPHRLDARDIRKQIADHGLEICGVGSGSIYLVDKLILMTDDPEISRQAQLRFNSLIEFAAVVGAPFVTIGGSRGRLALVNDDNARDHLIEILGAIAENAVRQNVKIVIEPLNRYETDIVYNTQDGLALIEEIGQPNIGLLLDTYHVNIEETSHTDCFRQAMAASRLWHIHLGDNNRLPPGQGHIDFGSIVSTLEDIGYNGYLSAELLPRPDPDTAGQQTIEHMREFVPAKRG
jgi:sugar phosphate isomerase/epimerase